MHTVYKGDKVMITLQDLIKKYAAQYKEQVVAWRRHIHSHPELSGEEQNTSLFIQKVLTELGIPFVNDVSDYAVIGKIEGAHTGPVIALRADIDALPIHEETGLPFASQNKGVMHACGHDSHIAILLGAAAILQSIKDQLHGTVKLVFQPSEEEALFPGAQGIVDSGILDDVDEIYGLHVWPQLPVGTVGLKKGNLMAASDHFLVHIKGKATHGAEPHNGIDAIVAAANWIVNVESMVARETNPMYTAMQLAIFTSLAAIPSKLLGAYAGKMVEAVGYYDFFWICFFLAIPGMLMLFKVAPWQEKTKQA